MRNKTSLKRKILSLVVSGILGLTIIFAPVSESLKPQRAEAAPSTLAGQLIQLVEEAGTFISTNISAIEAPIQTYLQSSLEQKDLILDGIAWQLANVVLEKMIQSTTQWVTSGFEGSPAFVTDFQGFMTDIGDQVAGDFIFKNGLSGLCSPFKLNIQAALEIQYRASRSHSSLNSQCRLTDAIENVENFLDGDFADGGWDTWFDIAMKPQNNIYGAMAAAQAGLVAEISDAKEAKERKLDWGQGFLDREECFDLPSDSETGEAGGELCNTITPGQTINDSLNKSLAGGQERLTVADEIDELIGALFAELGNKAITGAGGLLGLSESGGSGRPPGRNYFDEMADAAHTANQLNLEQVTFTSVLETENKYISLQNQVISYIDSADRTCGGLTASLDARRTAARREITNATALIDIITQYKVDYETLEAATTNSDPAIQPILSKYGADTVVEAQANLTSQYLGYKSSGDIHETNELSRIEVEVLKDPGDQREVWAALRNNIRAEVLLYTTDNPATRGRDPCVGRVTSSTGGPTAPIPFDPTTIPFTIPL